MAQPHVGTLPHPILKVSPSQSIAFSVEPCDRLVPINSQLQGKRLWQVKKMACLTITGTNGNPSKPYSLKVALHITDLNVLIAQSIMLQEQLMHEEEEVYERLDAVEQKLRENERQVAAAVCHTGDSVIAPPKKMVRVETKEEEVDVVN